MAADERIERIPDALKAVLADSSWLKKCALGALLTMLPYVGLVWVMGYGLHYQRAVAWGYGERLPEWRDAGPQLKTGFFALLAGMVYSLPITFVLMFVVLGGGALVALSVAAMEQPVAAIVIAVFSWIVYMLLATAAGVLLLPAYVHVQLYDTIDAGFQFTRIFGLVKSNAGAFRTALWRTVLLNVGSMMGLSVIALLAMGLTLLATMALSPDDWAPLAPLALYPAQFVAIIVGGAITMPLSLASHRLWGGYARAAYELDGPTSPHEVAV